MYLYIGGKVDVEKHIKLNNIVPIIILYQNHQVIIYYGFKDMIIPFMIQLYLMNSPDGLHSLILN